MIEWMFVGFIIFIMLKLAMFCDSLSAQIDEAIKKANAAFLAICVGTQNCWLHQKTFDELIEPTTYIGYLSRVIFLEIPKIRKRTVNCICMAIACVVIMAVSQMINGICGSYKLEISDTTVADLLVVLFWLFIVIALYLVIKNCSQLMEEIAIISENGKNHGITIEKIKLRKILSLFIPSI